MDRLRALVLIALALLPVAACGPLPHPFEHGPERAAYPLAELTLDVRVAPVEGLPGDISRTLTRAVAENLGGHGVTAVQRMETPARLVLSGKAAPPGEQENPDSTVQVGWTLYDADGVETGIHVQDLQVTRSELDSLDSGALRDLGATAAKAIAALIGIDSELPGGASTKRRGGLYVETVSGAPGDGNTALTAAIRRALETADIAVAADIDRAEHVLSCEVAVDPPAENGQGVAILWRISRPGGASIGEASQTNTVPTGSLDGRWGPVAGYAATAAIDGIQDILRRQQSRGTRPGFLVPATSDLPPPGVLRPPAQSPAHAPMEEPSETES